MSHADFIHLRVHSAYSLSQGAIRVPEIVSLAHEMRMPGVAITDTGNMFGALEFSQYCSKKGIQPIIGCQIALPARSDKPGSPAEPMVLLARNETGLMNLQYLSSAGFLQHETDEPTVPLDLLCERADGLFLMTGGTRGPLFRMLAEGLEADAARLLARLHEAFGRYMAVELHRHGLSAERAVEPGMIALADRMGIALVATNECFFPRPDMYEAHDALLCIAQGRTMAEQDRWRVTPEHWFKPPHMMRELFADLPEACDNTLEIARLCAVKVETRKPLLPVCPKVAPGATEEETLRGMARDGLERRLARMNVDDETRRIYEERLAFELDIIARMGFPGYFMIVADFIQWAKAHDIPVGPGRGSGAGSLAAWALTITDIDPIPFNLLFERFLNPERVSMPDFDIDFCQDRRDEVIRYVRQEYGPDRVAQIITFGKLQARAAVRDVGRVLGLSFGMVNKVAELIPNNPAKPVTLKQAIDGEPRLQEMRDSDETLRRLMEIALQLEGLFRHASTHAAGVVIGDRELVELVPLYRDPKSDMLVTQYNMKFVEQAGLVKFDFLGLTTLTILQRAVQFLEPLGVSVDLAALPLDDKLTYDMLARGDTGGVFQFEGAGMRDVLKQMRPTRLEDLIAAVALYRPGPMANIPDYCRRKHGEPWEPPHEEIRDILSETYGIMVYQEQVMQIAQKMAGYSLGGADLLRRAMGKKIRAEMDKQRVIFTEGATKRGIDHDKAVEVFDLMAKFADYGFNKSHAAAYALVSYQTAWMKANHPVAFLAACMSLAREKTEKLAALRQEAERLGIKVLPPDINASGADFTVEKLPDGEYGIRYALAAVKKVGLSAMQALVAVRGDRPFADMADIAARIDPRNVNKMQLENLARAGAFDTILPNRAQACASAETVLRRAQSHAQEAASGQIGLFGGGGGGAPTRETLRLPSVPDWPEFDRLNMEADAIGFHLTAHPLDSYGPLMRRLGVVKSTGLEAAAAAGITRVKIAGCVVDRKERPTRTGNKMAWVRLSDASGGCEVTFFSEVLSRSREILSAGNAVVVTADLRLDGEALRITASDVMELEQAAADAAAELRIWFDRADAIAPIRDILQGHSGGRGRIILLPSVAETRDVEVTLGERYRVTPRIAQMIKSIEGVGRVEQF
ncbi:DNA polymerase III subunit alpha [Gluconacetobacter entanii]|uniref:DNA polymerase III subunit alpha n=1 Tax=Gluconacetobacter entanii TaxID=108528 RepID=A0A318PYZ4_9PROT|nr:DNA polymerase III subunit alpha [Gluconacetobacter entanii]MCE2577271.1 DNA polymerase III subunit alpha [Komagataeibacter sp. FNDCR1]MBY4638548.1 DNA polymerase III subunit alpha [Gluconacetobacter entanii]MCW4581743.1 DNA polymerase III subunit alpha [Gluconacetobacter entanii]MCW4585139.1 DNA polymerase III subunit alpha [Gluconacetobacter entanii]MCW4588699.1 DNA polymerase III subunit alpha [Gluconacetobacter entanii]